ncbi:MAG: enterotoxin [Bacteroidia bacterium]|nr:enterotoxin [Bacteroidia bacterium]
MAVSFTEKKLRITGFEDKSKSAAIKDLDLPLFGFTLKNGQAFSSDDFTVKKNPVITDIAGNDSSQRLAGRRKGKAITALLESKRTGITIEWKAEIRDGANYIRQIFRFITSDADGIVNLTMVRLPASTGAVKAGNTDGSPIFAGNMFFALEYPLSKIKKDDREISISVNRLNEELSTIFGVVPPGQLRRGFQYYVEQERAHPYSQNLHYNSWFDISWDKRIFDEKESLDRIRVFGDSLIKARNIKMKGFLFDDGWDDHRTLWKFHSGFPQGFSNLKNVVQSYDSQIGVWMSPFGGYGESKEKRIEYGNKQTPPFETNRNGFSLSGPVYYNRFKEVAFDFIRNYGIFMFKFDGVGAGIGAGSGDAAEYEKDVESFLNLLKDLLHLKLDLYISMTTGTWPSVYWLRYGDNIWRGGDDTNMTGEGSKRQQWITYRDADVYKNIVMRGPLFPLNSLMTCGICIADNGNPGLFEMNDRDISDEIWSFFATGTNLQELYINPHKLNRNNWDCLADAAKWAKENESVMADVHWIGGDPSRGEVYGYAAWSEKKGVLSLRNPSSVDKVFNLNVKDVFEIPEDMNDNYLFSNVIPVAGGKMKPSVTGRSFMIILKPFELRVFDAVPVD